MPVISRFYGIVIRMYFLQDEHLPPHIHAIYGDDAASIEIMTGKLLSGGLPRKAMTLVLEWLSLHREELISLWETQNFKQINPLS